MTKKEVKAIIGQLWYELNNVNYYYWKLSLQQSDSDRLETFERQKRRQAAVEALRDLCSALGIEVNVTYYRDCYNILSGSYKGDTFMMWCLEYRDEYRDSAFVNYAEELELRRPKYYSSDLRINPSYKGEEVTK